MQQDDSYTLPEIDTKTASAARVYDYMLGGTDHYAVDRMWADQLEVMLPGSMAIARNNRRFLERVVRYLAEEREIRQFLDIGSGLPTQNNVHQIAQRMAPQARVVYVDSDPVVLAHQKVSALAENENTAFILADARDVDGILSHEQTTRLLDFSKPVAVLYLSFLHFVPDSDDPWGMVHHLMSHACPGSHLAISTIASEDSGIREMTTDYIKSNVKGGGQTRTKQQVEEFFTGLELVQPGLVDITRWRPDGREEPQSDHWVMFGGVACKPG